EVLVFLALDGDIDTYRIHRSAGDAVRHALSIGYLAEDHDLFGIEFRADAHGNTAIGAVVDDIVEAYGDIGLQSVGRRQQMIVKRHVQEVEGHFLRRADQDIVTGHMAETQSEIGAGRKSSGEVLIGAKGDTGVAPLRERQRIRIAQIAFAVLLEKGEILELSFDTDEPARVEAMRRRLGVVLLVGGVGSRVGPGLILSVCRIDGRTYGLYLYGMTALRLLCREGIVTHRALRIGRVGEGDQGVRGLLLLSRRIRT